MEEQLLAKDVKKIVRWGKGYAVFITKEAKLLKWSDKDHVSLTTIREGKTGKIVIKRLDVE